MKTILWLGAHKTGTTFLQKCLDLSQEGLREAGVFYMELEEFRVKYGRPLLNRDGSEPAPNEFSPPGTAVSLVFDENIPGYVQHALSRHGFYPEMTARADTITGYLGVEPDEIVFGIRSYDGYLPSLYCETLKSTPFATFDDYLAKAFARRARRAEETPGVEAMGRMSWAKLLGRLADHYPNARRHVYFHEHLRGHETRLLSTVTGVPADRISLLETTERVGFSGRAIERLHEIAEQRQVERRDVRRVVRRFPAGPEFPTFMPFDDAERVVLRERYHHDQETILADGRWNLIELG